MINFSNQIKKKKKALFGKKKKKTEIKRNFNDDKLLLLFFDVFIAICILSNPFKQHIDACLQDNKVKR